VQAPPRRKSRAWLLLAVTAVGASAIIWALAPTSKQQDEDSGLETASSATNNAQVDLTRLRRAIDVLSSTHADLANADRRAAISDLLSMGDAPSKLTMLLEAAAADPTPPDKDPFWADMVQGLSSIWRGDGINSGMDLMHIESRPRARDALVSSFAKLAMERTHELTPEQTQKLTENFIDLHHRVPAMQQREVEAAARKIAGNDVADLLRGKGMASDDELEYQREYKQSLEQNQPAAAPL
jgi:hypothetical protein